MCPVLETLSRSILPVLLSISTTDIFFLEDLNAGLSRRIGPIVTLMSWIRSAVATWPEAELIGKADDDVWANLPGTALHVRRVLAQLKNDYGITEMLWGVLEHYHWILHRGTPKYMVFEYKPRCMHMEWKPTPPFSEVKMPYELRANASHTSHEGRRVPGSFWPSDFNRTILMGPFPFMKGPLILVTRNLLHALVADQTINDYVSYITTASIDQQYKQLMPYEDVFLGAALAHIRLPPTNKNDFAAAYVGIGRGEFAPEHGLIATNTTLIYHAKTKKPMWICLLHRWMAEHGDLMAIPTSLDCGRKIHAQRSCSGVDWLPCMMAQTTHTPHNVDVRQLPQFTKLAARRFVRPYGCYHAQPNQIGPIPDYFLDAAGGVDVALASAKTAKSSHRSIKQQKKYVQSLT
eukprot:scaffold247808_cov35-Tisochrysis_lutea.AAC.4